MALPLLLTRVWDHIKNIFCCNGGDGNVVDIERDAEEMGEERIAEVVDDVEEVDAGHNDGLIVDAWMRGGEEVKDDAEEEVENDDVGVNASLWYDDDSWTATASWNSANEHIVNIVNAARAVGRTEVR